VRLAGFAAGRGDLFFGPDAGRAFRHHQHGYIVAGLAVAGDYTAATQYFIVRMGRYYLYFLFIGMFFVLCVF
jgi:hypothetical protein